MKIVSRTDGLVDENDEEENKAFDLVKISPAQLLMQDSTNLMLKD